MALRDQPYIPLYVKDFQTDEKLMECSAQATGVYIRLMCVLHKSEKYGTILLKQKDKQTDNQVKNFASKLAKHFPYSENLIFESLTELISEGVLTLDGDVLFQKRMVKDNDLSEKRSRAGKKGGDKNKFAQAKQEAKTEANSAIAIAIENNKEKEGVGEKEKLSLVFYDAKEICNEFINAGEWRNHILTSSFAKTHKINDKILQTFIIEYIEDQRIKNALNRSFGEYQRHFWNWIQLKLKKQ
jgi:uncharacterized protein YdaU (DUF1376 family)